MVTVTTVPGTDATPDWKQRDDFLREARDRFKLAADAERDIRERALEDLKFYSGEQWPDLIVQQRAQDGRPCLTINRLPELASQPINQQRQGRPQIQVNPRGGGATVETAETIQGITRHIEVASQAEAAYDWAFQSAIIGGFGYIQYGTEWADEESWDQDIRIKTVLNPFAVYMDPGCTDRLCRDAKWGFLVEDLLLADYKATYPKSSLAGLSDFRSVGDTEKNWFPDGMIRVAQYWYITFDTKILVKLTSGIVIPEDDLDKYPGAMVAVEDAAPLQREVKVPRVRSAVINAREVLSGNREKAPFGQPFPGRRVPIIPVLGEELIVDGKRILAGMVRYAKDAQRQYNYMRSALTEQIGLAPKAPFIIEEGQIEGHEHMWGTANTKNWAYLVYKRQDVNGNPAPPPQRNFGDPPIAAITQAVLQADADLKSTTRIHEPMIGAMGPEQSGRAIIARQNAGNLATFSWVDNLGQSIMRLGEDLVEMIRVVYARPGRLAQILKPDLTRKEVRVNEAFEEDGETHIYDLNQGRYDVTISVGPGYESKRQEFVASVLELVRSSPQIGGFIMDLVVRHMDWPGAKEIADRLKKMLPPQLQDEDKPEANQIPPAFAAQMEQLLQQHAALTERLNQATTTIESRRLELDSRERITAIQEQTKLLVAQLKADSQEEIESLRQQVHLLTKRLETLPPPAVPTDLEQQQPPLAA